MLQVISRKMRSGVQRYLIVRNECANKNYTTEFVSQLFAEEGKGAFSTRFSFSIFLVVLLLKKLKLSEM